MPQPHSKKLNAPDMSDDDIALFENALIEPLLDDALENMENKHREDIEILEWGAGYSSKYFSEVLDKMGVDFKWTSIENEKGWRDKVISLNPKNVEIKLFEYPMPKGEDRRYYKRRSVSMDEYVDYPTTLNKKFDIIFIDGYKRRRCLEHSLKLLKPHGIVLVHDAQRKWYHCAFEKYDGKFLSDTLWLGKLKFQ